MTRKMLPVSPALERVRRRLDRWRRAREGRARIPESLWSAAVELARQCGVSKTARVLRLDYYLLKKRLEGARVNAPPAEVTPTFFELVTPPVANGGRLSECTVEFDGGGGAKMRIQIKGADTADLIALSRTFLGSGR